MTTVADVLKFIESIAPPYMAESWDNVGLLCGRREKAVKKILVALDPFATVIDQAIGIGADLIVTPHPLIFQALKSVTDETASGRSIQLLCRKNISAINAHTNLDCAPGGVNDRLAAALGLTAIEVIDPMGVDADGKEWGLLRKGTVEEQSLSTFLPTVKTALGCEGLRYVSGGKDVHKVCVGGGACGSELMDAYRAGCDTFVTADVKYNQFWDAKDLGMTIIDAGHYYTENPVVQVLANKIQQAFPEIRVIVSQTHADCMKFF